VISAQPVLTAGTIAGLVLAAWNVVVAQGALGGLTPEAQDALAAFVNLLVPIVAALLAARLVTPISAPNLPIGTVVNERSDAPTGVVTPE
jgi:hypothetical protein